MNAAMSAALPKIPKELFDQFVHGPMLAEAIQNVSMAFKKVLIERALGGELSHHLGCAPGGDKPATTDNHRNGSTGKTVREIQGFLAEQYATAVSPEFISSVTYAVMAEVGAWQARPLKPMYPWSSSTQCA